VQRLAWVWSGPLLDSSNLTPQTAVKSKWDSFYLKYFCCMEMLQLTFELLSVSYSNHKSKAHTKTCQTPQSCAMGRLAVLFQVLSFHSNFGCSHLAIFIWSLKCSCLNICDCLSSNEICKMPTYLLYLFNFEMSSFIVMFSFWPIKQKS
jgi:hypothetical protein